MNLPALPELRAARNPDAPAVADDDIKLNNSQFLEAVRRASASLHRHGVADIRQLTFGPWITLSP